MKYNKEKDIELQTLQELLQKTDYGWRLKLSKIPQDTRFVAEITKKVETSYFYDKSRIEYENYLEKCKAGEELQLLSMSGTFFCKFHGRKYKIEDFNFIVNVSGGCVNRFLKRYPDETEYIGKMAFFKQTEYKGTNPQSVFVIKKPINEDHVKVPEKVCVPKSEKVFSDITHTIQKLEPDFADSYLEGTSPDERSLQHYMLIYFTSKFPDMKDILIDSWEKNKDRMLK